MRMWMVDPEKMCREHLLGEHLECHMFLGTLKRGISVKGYLDKGLLETHNLKERHDVLATEMKRRGYHHKSPLDDFEFSSEGIIDRVANEQELARRCKKCDFVEKEN